MKISVNSHCSSSSFSNEFIKDPASPFAAIPDEVLVHILEYALPQETLSPALLLVDRKWIEIGKDAAVSRRLEWVASFGEHLQAKNDEAFFYTAIAEGLLAIGLVKKGGDYLDKAWELASRENLQEALPLLLKICTGLFKAGQEKRAKNLLQQIFQRARLLASEVKRGSFLFTPSRAAPSRHGFSFAPPAQTTPSPKVSFASFDFFRETPPVESCLASYYDRQIIRAFLECGFDNDAVSIARELFKEGDHSYYFTIIKEAEELNLPQVVAYAAKQGNVLKHKNLNQVIGIAHILVKYGFPIEEELDARANEGHFKEVIYGCIRLKKFEKAIHLVSVCQLAPHDFYPLISSLVANGAGAEACHLAASKNDPFLAVQAHFQFASRLAHSGKLEEAEAEFEKGKRWISKENKDLFKDFYQGTIQSLAMGYAEAGIFKKALSFAAEIEDSVWVFHLRDKLAQKGLLIGERLADGTFKTDEEAFRELAEKWTGGQLSFSDISEALKVLSSKLDSYNFLLITRWAAQTGRKEIAKTCLSAVSDRMESPAWIARPHEIAQLVQIGLSLSLDHEVEAILNKLSMRVIDLSALSSLISAFIERGAYKTAHKILSSSMEIGHSSEKVRETLIKTISAVMPRRH